VESWEKWSGFRVGRKDDGKRWIDLMREEELRTSSYRDTQGPEYPGLKEIRPINEMFKRALS